VSVALSSSKSKRLFPELSSPKNPSLDVSLLDLWALVHGLVPQRWSLSTDQSTSEKREEPCRLEDLWLLYSIRGFSGNGEGLYAQRDCQRGSKSAAPMRSSKGRP